MSTPPWLPSLTRRLALLTLGCTLVLLLIGGIVHGTGSSLACPDWPTCFGTFFPPMKGNVLVEHGHRLFATGVGTLTLVLCALLAWGRHGGARARNTFYLGLLAVWLVCFQGLLGGLTVIYRLPTLISAAHLATSMLFFGTIAAIATLLWRGNLPRQGVGPGTYRLAVATLIIAYGQIVLGGLVRHTGAGLACLDLPLCHGQVLPFGEHPTVILQAVHRLGALIVLGLGLVLARQVAAQAPKLGKLAVALPLLVLVQISLGVMSVLSFLGLFYVTAHLGVAALVLYTLVRLCLSLEEAP